MEANVTIQNLSKLKDIQYHILNTTYKWHSKPQPCNSFTSGSSERALSVGKVVVSEGRERGSEVRRCLFVSLLVERYSFSNDGFSIKVWKRSDTIISHCL